MRLIILANLNSGQNIIFKNFVKIRKRGYTNEKVGERVPPPKKSGERCSPPFPPQYTTDHKASPVSGNTPIGISCSFRKLKRERTSLSYHLVSGREWQHLVPLG